MEFIKATPTWKGLMPMLIAAYENTHDPKIMEEILRCAEAADELNRMLDEQDERDALREQAEQDEMVRPDFWDQNPNAFQRDC